MSFWSINAKILEQNILMTQMHLLCSQTLWMMFMRTLITTTQTEKQSFDSLWWLISLAQLKAGNNSERFKNEIRQLLYSLYKSKNLQWIFIKNWLTLFKTWKQFLWTASRFRLDLAGKRNLEHPKRNTALTNLSIYYT